MTIASILLTGIEDFLATRARITDPRCAARTAETEALNSSWISRVVRLNFLAAELVTDILAGSHPAVLSAARLTSAAALPLSWDQQVEHFTSADLKLIQSYAGGADAPPIVCCTAKSGE